MPRLPIENAGHLDDRIDVQGSCEVRHAAIPETGRFEFVEQSAFSPWKENAIYPRTRALKQVRIV